MKKIISFMLSLILILSITAYAETAEASIAGTWYSNMYFNVLTMKIDEGGIYNMELMDEAMIGTWVLEGNTLYLDKGTAGETALNYDADAQTIGQSGFLFARKKIKAFKPGKAVKADIEDFAGNWTAVSVDSPNATLPLDLDDFCMDAAIEGTQVILSIGTENKEIVEGAAVFENSKLHLTIPAADNSANESTYTIAMQKKGFISIDDGTTVYYLEKAAGESQE